MLLKTQENILWKSIWIPQYMPELNWRLIYYDILMIKFRPLGVFQDLSKAFYTISQALAWFRVYLTGRKQFAIIKTPQVNNTGDGMWSSAGLGIRTFIMHYIYQWFSKCPAILQMCTVCRWHHVILLLHDLATAVRNITTDLENWFKNNKLSLNIAKTNFMLFSKKHPKLTDGTINLSLANETINKVHSTKFIGMVIN